MIEFSNMVVYGLEESIIASGLPMIKEILYSYETNTEVKNSDFKRAISLGSVKSGTGHDNFLKGIVVQFDLKYPQYFTPQLQRYSFVDIVSSQSKMHKLCKMDIKSNCNKYVSNKIIKILEGYIKEYNNSKLKEEKYETFMKVISNTPLGFELTMRISTNYLQLKTIYNQRKNHKLKEDWGEFCNKIETLPHFKDLCLKGE